MKNQLSIAALAARGSLRKVLLLFAAMVITECVVFYWALRGFSSVDQYSTDNMMYFENLISRSYIFLIFAAALAMLCGFLCKNGCSTGSSVPGYTLRRLRIEERSTFIGWAAYNTLCIFALWGTQVMTIILLFKLYTLMAPAEYAGNQSLFLSLYSNKFLHSLLPLAETSRYFRNTVLWSSLGVTSACYPFWQRHGARSNLILPLINVVILFFPKSMGGLFGDITLALSSAGIAVYAASQIWGKAYEKAKS